MKNILAPKANMSSLTIRKTWIMATLFATFLYINTQMNHQDTEDLRKLKSPEKKHATQSTSGRGSSPDTVFRMCAVSTEVPLCSKIGVNIMKQGGNAMDAAIASTICVGIINSFSSGIGGGGFMLIRKPTEGKDVVDMVDFRETAPSDITVEYLQAKPDLTKVSGTSVAVPGEIKGLYIAHKRYGRLPWKELFTKNIEIANDFEASEQLCRRLKKLRTYIFADEGLRKTYTRGGNLVVPGQKIQRKNYARTLRKIAEDPESFYTGEIAEKIVKSVRSNGGVLNKQDLASYKAVHRKVLTGKYRDYIVYTTNLPTSGAFIIQALNVMENFDLPDIARVGRETRQYPHYHLLIEIFKFMAAKRGELADPDFLPGWEELVKEIISDKYAQSIVEKIDFNSVLAPEEYGRVLESTDDHGTTHLNVVDRDDMVVLVTSTVNLEFGAKFMDEETGIIFNNEVDDFYVPKVKNAFDLDKMGKNTIKPRKRPFSSAAPVIMMKHDEIIAIGAAGGTRIPTSIFSVIFHLILGRNLHDAIMESRIHNQLVPVYTYIESSLDKRIIKYLRSLGHNVAVSSQNSIFTSVQGIRVLKLESGERRIEAFSDKRKGGVSSGM